MAGVSPGTVDRVLHNRGDVSTASKIKVNEVLSQINYEPSLHLSSIGVKHSYSIAVVIPQFHKGEYWNHVENGIRRALYEFSNIQLKVKFLYYNQFDLFSCRQTYHKALETKYDAMIIGPTFGDETIQFASRLANNDIPYVFVDTNVANCRPLAFYGPDSSVLGVMEAKLLLSVVDKRKDIVLFQACRVGNESSLQTITRKYGFADYLKSHSQERKILFGTYYNDDETKSWNEFDEFFAKNKNVGGAVVFNSRAYIVAGYLRHKKMSDVKLVGCGVIERNIAELRRGYISYLISERPSSQGYNGVKRILEHLLFSKQGEVINYMPLDILVKENIDYFLASDDN